MFLFMTIAGGFVLSSYILGFSAFKNIWIVSAISVIFIIIIEPLIAWTIFSQVPTHGAIIGLVLGVIGLFFTIFF